MAMSKGDKAAIILVAILMTTVGLGLLSMMWLCAISLGWVIVNVITTAFTLLTLVGLFYGWKVVLTSLD
jgi:hypothetical protein